jgi:cytoskeletal protein CcmA (bactofilin family)
MALLRSKQEDLPSTPMPRPSGRSVDSLIAPGMVLRGDCETEGVLRVEGRVTGNIRANGLTVSHGGEVEGDVTGPGGAPSRDTVMIEGRVQGSVRAPRVEVGRNGLVGAGMEVTEATVRGRVTGPIVAEHRLVLEETAVVDGDVTAKRLGLKEGGQVFGTIRIGERADTGPSPRPERPFPAEPEEETGEEETDQMSARLGGPAKQEELEAADPDETPASSDEVAEEEESEKIENRYH